MILLRLATATALLAKKSAAIFSKSYIWSGPAQIALIGPTLSVYSEDWTSAMNRITGDF
jgi:hypothetical protein